jgi:membrane protease YdiL (CAAX protease family)
MHHPAHQRGSVSSVTWIGLVVALFAMLVVRQTVAFFSPSLTLSAVFLRESLHWLCAVALLIIVRRGEHLPLTSIGIGTSRLSFSILWGIVLTFVCAAVGFGIAVVTHFHGGRSGESLAKLPLWLVSLIVVRAGVIEELFYRGYAIERLQVLGLRKYWAAAIPLVIFAVGHWSGGWANIVIALALGGILSGFYLWRRDLIANIIAHFMVDFIGVVLPRMAHHS